MAEVAKAAKAAADSTAEKSSNATSPGGMMSFSDKGLCPDLSVSQVRPWAFWGFCPPAHATVCGSGTLARRASCAEPFACRELTRAALADSPSNVVRRASGSAALCCSSPSEFYSLCWWVS